MAARFTHGDSIKSTRTLSRTNNAGRKEPPAKNHAKLPHHNTMTGMPGYIDAHPHVKIDGAKGGHGAGPKREGLIGRHGESERFKATSHGTIAKDAIHGEHKGHVGGIKSNLKDGTHHLHTKNVSHKMTNPGSPPTSHGKIPGGGKHAGIGHSAGAKFGTGVGQGGRMEKLKGSVRTASEGRKKSVMY